MTSLAPALALAVALLGLGAVVVLVRRERLVVLMGGVLMSSAGVLALTLLARHHADASGLVFAAVAVAAGAARLAVGLALELADPPDTADTERTAPLHSEGATAPYHPEGAAAPLHSEGATAPYHPEGATAPYHPEGGPS